MLLALLWNILNRLYKQTLLAKGQEARAVVIQKREAKQDAPKEPCVCDLIALSTHVDMITYMYIQYYIIFYFYGHVSFAWDSLFIWNAESNRSIRHVYYIICWLLKNTSSDSSCLRPKWLRLTWLNVILQWSTWLTVLPLLTFNATMKKIPKVRFAIPLRHAEFDRTQELK